MLQKFWVNSKKKKKNTPRQLSREAVSTLAALPQGKALPFSLHDAHPRSVPPLNGASRPASETPAVGPALLRWRWGRSGHHSSTDAAPNARPHKGKPRAVPGQSFGSCLQRKRSAVGAEHHFKVNRPAWQLRRKRSAHRTRCCSKPEPELGAAAGSRCAGLWDGTPTKSCPGPAQAAVLQEQQEQHGAPQQAWARAAFRKHQAAYYRILNWQLRRGET